MFYIELEFKHTTGNYSVCAQYENSTYWDGSPSTAVKNVAQRDSTADQKGQNRLQDLLELLIRLCMTQH